MVLPNTPDNYSNKFDEFFFLFILGGIVNMTSFKRSAFRDEHGGLNFTDIRIFADSLIHSGLQCMLKTIIELENCFYYAIP